MSHIIHILRSGLIFALVLLPTLVLGTKTPIKSSGGIYVIMPDQLRKIFDEGSILVPSDTPTESWKLSPAEAHNHFGLQLSAPMTSDMMSSSATWSEIHKILIDDTEVKIIVILDDDYTPYKDSKDPHTQRGYVAIAFIRCDGSDSRKLPGRAFLKMKMEQTPDDAEPKDSTSDSAGSSTSSTVSSTKAAPTASADAKAKDKDKAKIKDTPAPDKSAFKDGKTKDASDKNPAKDTALANSLLTGSTTKSSLLSALRKKN